MAPLLLTTGSLSLGETSRFLMVLYYIYIYLFLAQNKLPTSKATIRKVETLAEQYILLDRKCYNKILYSSVYNHGSR